MSLPDEPDPHASAFEDPGPTREFLFAQALETCLSAERRTPGSADALIADQPDWARPELSNLVRVARALSAAGADAIMSDEYRAAARARLILAVGGSPSDIVDLASARLSLLPSMSSGARRGRRGLLIRSSAGLLAAMLGIMATVTASASALPGEPLYGVKQAQEELAVRLAADDRARALALLRSADARLDETNRLLRQGRTSEAARTTQRYDQDVQRATTTFIVTIEDAAGQTLPAAPIDTHLSQQQERLQSMLQSAPEPARADLRDALVATERVRALVADPRPLEQALGRSTVEPGRATTLNAAVAAEAPFVAAAPTAEPVVAGLTVERTPEPVRTEVAQADTLEPGAVVDEHTPQASPPADIVAGPDPVDTVSPRTRAREAPRVAEPARRVVTPPLVAEINSPAIQRERSTSDDVLQGSDVVPVRAQEDDKAPPPQALAGEGNRTRPPLTARGEAAPGAVLVNTSNASERTRTEDKPATSRSSDSADVNRPPTQTAAQPQAVVQPAPSQAQPTTAAVAQANTSRDSNAGRTGDSSMAARADAAAQADASAPSSRRPATPTPTPAPNPQTTQRRTETASDTSTRGSTTTSSPTKSDSPASSRSDGSNRNQGD